MKHQNTGVWMGSDRGLDAFGQGLDAARAGLVRAGAGLALLALAACSSPEDSGAAAADPVAAATASAAPAAASATASPDAQKVAFVDNSKQDTAERKFAYEWPAEVSAIPALTQRLTADRTSLLAEQKADWTSALKEFAGSDCVGCVNRDFEKAWQVVANLPRYLSLSASFYTYTGGAHGNSGTQGLIWDRESGTALEPEDLFISPKAMQDAMGTRWCKGLSGARRAKMGGEGPVDEGTFPCPPIADLVVLLGSAGKTAFDRIGLIADPYVAGSYAEGQYEVTIPVTAEVLKAVKPEYRGAFALAK